MTNRHGQFTNTVNRVRIDAQNAFAKHDATLSTLNASDGGILQLTKLAQRLNALRVGSVVNV